MADERTRSSISIVIPAYNEEANIEEVVLRSLNVLRSLTDRYEILVMDDASQDRTWEIAEGLAEKYPGWVRIFRHQKNTGTNICLRELFREAQCDLVFFLPADKQILPDSIPRYLTLVENEGADVVLGWRERRADPPHRLFFNWAYRQVLRFFLGIDFHDAAASDLYKKVVLDKIDLESQGRLLQAEIAAKAAALGFRVLEVPVEHYPRVAGKQTGVKPKTAWLSFYDLLRVGPKIRALKKKASPISQRPLPPPAPQELISKIRKDL